MSVSDQIVFIVDDDENSRDSVGAMISTMGLPSQLFDSAEQFLEFYNGESGCLISDLRLPGLNAVELLDALHSRKHRLPTIVISAFAEVPVAVEVMRRGAITLLEKPYHENELWDAVRAGLKQDAKVRVESEDCHRIRTRMGTLTDGERDILQLMVDGLPNKAIKHRMELSIRTVEKRRRMVFEKMQVESVAHLVQEVFVANGCRRLTDNDFQI